MNEKKSSSEIYEKMRTALKVYIEKKEAEETTHIQQINNHILTSFEYEKDQMINTLNKIYSLIIQKIHANQSKGDHRIEQHSYPVLIAVLSEYFPTSTFSLLHYNENLEFLQFNISAADIVLNKDVIDNYRAYLAKKEDLDKQIESLKRKRDELEQDKLVD